MQQAVTESRFREIREGLYKSREDVIRRTVSVSLGTLRNVELGRPVRRGNARQLLEALNSLLAESGRDPVSLDDLQLTLY